MENEEKEKHAEYTMLPPSMGGGPKGLGDPDDRTLRTIESDILIHKLMREKSEELCIDKRNALTKCLDNCSSAFTILQCRPQTRELRMCQYDWFQDPNFKKQVTEDYLDMRSEYRRTGITKQQRDKQQKKEEMFLDWQKKYNKVIPDSQAKAAQ